MKNQDIDVADIGMVGLEALPKKNCGVDRMSDSELRRIINNKYNIVIDGFGYIETACIQPVINTVRQFDDEKNTRIIEEAINAMQVKHQSELKKAQLISDRLLVLATKHCPITHHDFEEICLIAEIGEGE